MVYSCFLFSIKNTAEWDQIRPALRYSLLAVEQILIFHLICKHQNDKNIGDMENK